MYIFYCNLNKKIILEVLKIVKKKEICEISNIIILIY